MKEVKLNKKIKINGVTYRCVKGSNCRECDLLGIDCADGYGSCMCSNNMDLVFKKVKYTNKDRLHYTILTMSIIIMILLAISTSKQASAQEFKQGFELSYSNDSDYRVYAKKTSIVLDMSQFCFRHQIRFECNKFEIKADTYCFFNYVKPVKFSPYLMMFDIHISYRVNKFNITASHRCLHPCISIVKPDSRVIGGYNLKLSVSYNIK